MRTLTAACMAASLALLTAGPVYAKTVTADADGTTVTVKKASA